MSDDIYIPSQGIMYPGGSLSSDEEDQVRSQALNLGHRLFNNKDDANSYKDAMKIAQLKTLTGSPTHPDDVFDSLNKSQSSNPNILDQNQSEGNPTSDTFPTNVGGQPKLKVQNTDKNKSINTGSPILDNLLAYSTGVAKSLPGEDYLNAGIQSGLDKITNTPGSYKENLKLMKNTQNSINKEFPKSTTAGEITGDTAQYLGGDALLKKALPVLASSEEGISLGNTVKGIVRGSTIAPAITLSKGDTKPEDLERSAEIGGVSSLLGDVAGAATEGIGNTSKGIINSIFKPSQAEIKSGAAEGIGDKTLADQFIENGDFGPASYIKNKSQAALPELYEQKNALVNGIKKINPETHATEIYNQMLEDNPEASFDSKNAAPYAKRLNRVLSQMENGQNFSGPQYETAKQDLQSQASSAYSKNNAGNPKDMSYSASAAAADARGAKLALEEQVPNNPDGTNPLAEVNKKIAYHNAVIKTMNNLPKTSAFNNAMTTMAGTVGGGILGSLHGGSTVEGGILGATAFNGAKAAANSTLAKTTAGQGLSGLYNLLKGSEAAKAIPAISSQVTPGVLTKIKALMKR